VLGIVLIRGFGHFDHLLVVKALRKADIERGQRNSGMVRRFGLLDAMVKLSSKPVSACQPAEENHHTADESNQRNGNCAGTAKAVGTALH
jgi:hypothetical protein